MCDFSLSPCPKQCNVYLMNKDLHHHLESTCPNRDHECEYCGMKDTFASITQIHDASCAKKILHCPNAECAKVMLRQEIEDHVKGQCEHI